MDSSASIIDEPVATGFASRLAVFLYGLAAYAIGVAALVAWIVSMMSLVPFSGGPIQTKSTGGALMINLLLLIAFALQHSVMARKSFKSKWTRIIPKAAERSTYVLATGLVLLPVLGLWQPVPGVIWAVDSAVLRMAVYALALAGWAYLFLATFAINHFELFGLRQVYQQLRGKPITSVPFRERWMYRFDRHPIMTGALLGLWITPIMTLDHLAFSVGFTVYVIIGVYFEERALLRQWGSVYEAYCRRVGSIVPSFKRLG
ncbi:MAG: hypothetical protein ABI672_18805 [Vicinamibacteria bacterium]